MARGRLLSKSLGSSRKFHALLGAGGKLGEFCQVLFPLLIANTDDYGRLPGDAFTVKNVVLPSSRRIEKDFDQALNIMHRVGLIVRYVANDSQYLQIVDFDGHQPNLHKRSKPKFPEAPADSGISGKSRDLPPQSNPELNPEPRTQNPEENPEPRTALTRTADGLFDAFWSAYPKKKARDAAKKAWDKRRPDAALLGIMLTAIETQKRSADWTRDGGKWIPHPATWLNDGRWTDVVDVDVGDVGRLSDTARHNIAAVGEMERLLRERDAGGGREH